MVPPWTSPPTSGSRRFSGRRRPRTAAPSAPPRPRTVHSPQRVFALNDSLGMAVRSSFMSGEDLTIEPWLGDRFEEALRYALRVHGGQTRKSTRIPYMAHLLGVTSLVLEDGGTEDQGVAALLHDAPEDQGGQERLADIERRFGEKVARIVSGCSDTLERPKPPWVQRKQQYIRHLVNVEDVGILRVSISDKLWNLRAIRRDVDAAGLGIFERFNAKNPAQHVAYFRLLGQIYNDRFRGPLVAEFRTELTALIDRLAALGVVTPAKVSEVDLAGS